MQITLKDNGSGALDTPDSSSIDYVTGALSLTPHRAVVVPKFDYQYRVDAGQTPPVKVGTAVGVTNIYKEALYDNTPVTATYASSAGTTPTSEVEDASLSFSIPTLRASSLVTESIVFKIAANTYIVRGGSVYQFNGGTTFNLGAPLGSFDPAIGLVTMNPGVTGAVTILGAAQYLSLNTMSNASFIIAASPILPNSLTVSVVDLLGVNHIATIDNNGDFNHPFIHGKAELEGGYVSVRFGTFVTPTPAIIALPEYDPLLLVNGLWFLSKEVDASSMTFTATGSNYFPTNADILGADTTRLPTDGRVPIYNVGDTVVILNDTTTAGTYTSGQTVSTGVTNTNKVTVYDNLGAEVPAIAITSVNLVTGTVTFGTVTGLSQPLQIVSRIESTHAVTDVQITNNIQVSPPVSRVFPTGSLVSNALLMGDLQAFATDPFTQQTFTGVWSDSQIGNGTIGQPNTAGFPIMLANYATVTERWALIFTSPTIFNLVGEQLGQVATGLTISAVNSPINVVTGLPYFTLPVGFFGAGWVTGNVIRFNTQAPNKAVTAIKTVSPGAATSSDYKFCIEFRADVNSNP